MSRALLIVTPVAIRVRGCLPSAEWLAGREELLTRVTAAAVRRVKAALTWIWLVDPRLAEQAAEIRARVYPEAVFVDWEHPDTEAIAPDEESFLTVRVDSDDAIAPAAIDKAAALDLPSGALVNWPAGWQLDWQNGALAERDWPRRVQSPFLAIANEGRGRLLELGGDHSRARRGRAVFTMPERSWLQVTHGGNVVNRRHGDPRVPADERDAILAEFGVTA